MKRKHPEAESDFIFAQQSRECQEATLSWPRAPLPSDFSPETYDIDFQQMEIKYDMEGVAPRERPVIRLFGCSLTGYSIALSVYNFAPYFYLPVECWNRQPESVDDFAQWLNEKMRTKLGHQDDDAIVAAVTVEDRMSIMYYRETTSRFYRIVMHSPKHVAAARTLLEQELGEATLTYESNVAYVLRFMIDKGVGGASWLHLPAGKYRFVDAERERCPAVSLELEIDCADLVARRVDDEAWAHNAPLRTLSFDIECSARPGSFPDPLCDPVIQIANCVTVQGQRQPIINNIFVLDSCSPIAGCDVRCYRTERELLTAWSQFVVTVDPDLLTGYNIVQFDMGYLIDRAKKLSLKQFACFSRVAKQAVRSKDAKFSSAQTGTRESKEWFVEGRVMFDMYQVIVRDHKLSSYTLNNVSAHFLDQQKEDVHHTQISKLHAGTADDRRRLAVYCCKDALLPQQLIENRMALVNYVEMARVTGVPFSFLLTRGQGIKVVSQILRKARELGVLMPALRSSKNDDDHGFQGATVINPKVGFYEKPIPTLDFSSLYPSIMQAHNLCYMTLLPPQFVVPVDWVEGQHYETTPMGHRFVMRSMKKGILTMILEDLLGARGRAKKLMAAATDKSKAQVFNGRQLALKVSANSVYGFTGQSVGALPCVEISSSVTSYGRDMLMLTKKVVESEYSIANGFPHNAEVVYGDTDSVMVCTGLATVAESIEWGVKAAALVSTYFPKPIKLEFEKVYFPWLLMSKKKYAGLFWTKPENYDKIDSKGIESVRRDNCGLVRFVVDHTLQKILFGADIAGAVSFCKSIISDVLQNKVDLSLLVITKSYSREASAYKTPQAHIELAKRMAERDPATAPCVGERIPFVIVSGDKKSKMCEKAEDPLYVLKHDIPIDAHHYIKQLIKPVCRLLKPVVENPEALLTTGDHMSHLVVPRAKSTGNGGGKGSLFGFFVVRETCIGCHTPLASDEKVLCKACLPITADIYVRQMGVVREKEMQFGRLWTHCQSCQGNMYLEVICSANDCPIFYKRTKVYNELHDAQKAIARFDNLAW